MLTILLYLVFTFSALLLIGIVLLQEGKGGGLSDAFGGAGAETFGVRAGGINRFTFGLFGVFVLSALLLHWTASPDDGSVIPDLGNSTPPAATGAPEGGGGGSEGGQ